MTMSAEQWRTEFERITAEINDPGLSSGHRVKKNDPPIFVFANVPGPDYGLGVVLADRHGRLWREDNDSLTLLGGV